MKKHNDCKQYSLNLDPGVVDWNLLRGVVLTFFLFLLLSRNMKSRIKY